jgi:hypothetical protein
MVNVVDQPTYELDVQNAKPAKPILKARGEADDEFLTEKFKLDSHSLSTLVEERASWVEMVERSRKTIRNEQHKMAFLGLLIICLGSITVIGVAIKSRPVIIYFITAFACIICLRYYYKVRRLINKTAEYIKQGELSLKELMEKITKIIDENAEEITVGYQPVCPYCMTVVDNLTANPSSGLTHCLKCGKQFHYSNQNSYPIKFK